MQLRVWHDFAGIVARLNDAICVFRRDWLYDDVFNFHGPAGMSGSDPETLLG